MMTREASLFLVRWFAGSYAIGVMTIFACVVFIDLLTQRGDVLVYGTAKFAGQAAWFIDFAACGLAWCKRD